MKSETVVLLTGGSSGIGQCTARYLAEAGCRVYELSRRDSSQPGIIHLTCGVTREEQVQAAVKTVAEREGRIDIVVNNAGFGISGAVEFTQTADAQRLLDVNFFGMVRVNRAVLPYMREAGRGRIVNLSSVAAVAPIPFQTYYSASKAAVNAYTMALANEVRPLASPSAPYSRGTLPLVSPPPGRSLRQGIRLTTVGLAALWPGWSTMRLPVCPRRLREPSLAGWRSGEAITLYIPSVAFTASRYSC